MSPAPRKPIPPGGGPVADFARELRALCANAGLSNDSELARLAHLSKSTVSRALGGMTLPSISTVRALARTCGTEATEWEHRRAAVTTAQPQMDAEAVTLTTLAEGVDHTATAGTSAIATRSTTSSSSGRAGFVSPPPSARRSWALWRGRGAVPAITLALSAFVLALGAIVIGVAPRSSTPNSAGGPSGTIPDAPTVASTTTTSTPTSSTSASQAHLELRYLYGARLLSFSPLLLPETIAHAAYRTWPTAPPATSTSNVPITDSSDYWKLSNEYPHTSTTFTAVGGTSTKFALHGVFAFTSTCGAAMMKMTIDGATVTTTLTDQQNYPLPDQLPPLANGSTLTVTIDLLDNTSHSKPCDTRVHWQNPSLTQLD